MWKNSGPKPIISSRPDPGRNFYFHASLWCLKRFYYPLQPSVAYLYAPENIIKPKGFLTKECENKNTTFWNAGGGKGW